MDHIFCSKDLIMTEHRDTALREQKMLEHAKMSILDSGDLLPQDQIAQRLTSAKRLNRRVGALSSNDIALISDDHRRQSNR
jgi:hypothetical protein